MLANEEVIDGKSERGGHPVVRMPLRQWMLRITAYADRLEKDLEGLDWSEGIKALQRNWIGRSTGAEVDFFIGEADARAPRVAGAEFEAGKARSRESRLSAQARRRRPPHLHHAARYALRRDLHGDRARASVRRAADDARASKRREGVLRSSRPQERPRPHRARQGKDGRVHRRYAINPVNGEPMPIWVADYVLISYGTGAIMAVPAHDERDFEFAKQFDLPIIAVVDPGEADRPTERDEVLAGKRVLRRRRRRHQLRQLQRPADRRVQDRRSPPTWPTHGLGREAVNYKLRDWLFCRQRFWGEPFPILHELDADGKPTGRIRAVDAKDLPVDLPHLEDFKPHGRPEPPLDKAPDDWLYPVIDGKRYKRETNTMPQWAGSCWYYLRFLDPKNDQRARSIPRIEKAWMPVDLYVGGAEHAVLHLLYARFWHKVLFDRGIVSTPEPFQKLVNQGMILGENNEKMSKSRGNVINPDAIVHEYGADSLRLYEMFMGPLEAVEALEHARRQRRLRLPRPRLAADHRRPGRNDAAQRGRRRSPAERRRKPHPPQTIRRGHRRHRQALVQHRHLANDGVHELTSRRERAAAASDGEIRAAAVALRAAHGRRAVASLGHKESLAYEPWPEFDPALAKEDTIEMPVQINGKLRAKITVPADADAAQLEAAAKADPRIAELLAGKADREIVVVPGRMVNIVVKDSRFCGRRLRRRWR